MLNMEIKLNLATCGCIISITNGTWDQRCRVHANTRDIADVLKHSNDNKSDNSDDNTR